MAQRQVDQAITHYEQALSLNPEFAEAHNNLGLMLAAQGKTDQAVAHYEQALLIRPGFAEAHNNLGLMLAAQGKIDEAVVHYEQALSIKPNYAAAHITLGNALSAQGQPQQAVTHYKRALSLWPPYASGHSNLLYALNYACGNDPASVYAAHLEYAALREAPLAMAIAVHVNDRSPDRRLKIGYVSSDFRLHSVSYFIEPVLIHHNHDHFEIFCYANNLQKDEVTERLKSHVDHWRPINVLSDEQAAQHIRRDQIDILIDLNGHTGNNRLLVFARKPAPVQVTWLGYPNTTGLSAMDYRLTDGFADPPGMTEQFHSEKLVRLPECFSCYQPPRDAPDVARLPALKNGYVNFGSFNNLAKINREVMTVWAKILQAVPDSRLILKNAGLGGKTAQKIVRKTFTEFGVAPERLELLGRDQSEKDHLQRYESIDIGLDPFPYNGATTTCEALWMGVPVVVLAGKTHAGRVGVSQLNNLGLTDLIGHTTDEYIAISTQLTRNLDHLSQLRAELRSRMATSSLTNGQRFIRNLEQTYRQMWQDWCLLKDVL